MIRSTRVAGPVAWVLLLGSFLAASACAGPTPTTVADLISLSASEHQRILRDGMIEGRLLYVKVEQFQSEPSGNLPQRFVTETWLGANPDGTFDTAVVTLWLEDGPDTMDTLVTYRRSTLSDWLGYAWKAADYAQRSGAEFKGRGKLHGWDSLIYEWRKESDIQRLEIVENAPLITRESDYAIDQQGELTLLRSNTVLEYQLLPPGSETPPLDY